MVLGTTYYHAAGVGWGTTKQPRNPLPVFRTVCLAALILGGAMLAGGFAAPTPTPAETTDELTKSEANADLPLSLPAPESVEKPKRKTFKNPKAAATLKQEKSVLLPPIQTPTPSDQIPLPSRALPFQQPTARRNGPPSLLEPPPAVAPMAKPRIETALEVIVGQTRLLTFPDVPHRVALAVDESDPIATLREVPHKPCEWYLIGKKPGSTFLDVWLPDPSNETSRYVQHFSVSVRTETEKKVEKREEIASLPLPSPPPSPPAPPPPAAPSLSTLPPMLPPPPQTPMQPPPKREVNQMAAESIYQTLEQEINRTFPGCTVHLKQVGESLVVSGQARNVFEATRILTIARENAPGSRTEEPSRVPAGKAPSTSLQATVENYAQAGGRHVVNLLRIPGEQQIMLRIVVAEVNRAAARSLGLDFGIADKQATILPNRSASGNGASTVAPNGWIGSLLRTLQEQHYAQSLAEPTLTTLNGQTARFKAGGEFPVPVVMPGPQGAVQGVSFRSYGVHLAIQPVVADIDRIRLAVEAEVTAADPQSAAQVGNTAVPGLKTRNFESTVELREGETLAVAGLIRHTGNFLPNRNVPLNATIPASAEPELVVLISPVLLNSPKPAEEKAAPALKPQDIESYLRSRNVSIPPGDAPYLIGPQGYAGATRQGSTAGR